MSRKDYCLIAAGLKEVGSSSKEEDREIWKKIRDKLIDKLQGDNPRFDRGKFIQACEGKR